MNDQAFIILNTDDAAFGSLEVRNADEEIVDRFELQGLNAQE
ncbi:MAG: hypothetical protein WEC59_06930 [Salibacteraceae bacterium]